MFLSLNNSNNIIYCLQSNSVLYYIMIIGICELYNPKVHGGDNTYMKYKYLITTEVTQEEFFGKEYEDLLYSMREAYEDNPNYTHNGDYENYTNIVTNPKYYQLQVIDDMELDTYEMVGTIKTHYIALIQRKWKKIYAQRKCIISQRTNVKALMVRQLTGRFPKHCAKYT